MRVLVIEDEVRLAETIRRGLLSEGFSVDVHHRGDDGFESATVDHFDAIVVDIMLPGRAATRSSGACGRVKSGHRS